MSFIKMMLTSFSNSTTSTPKPMTILISIIGTSLMMALEISSKVSSPWPALLMVMSINGGLMILYIFIISMTQQEKSEEKSFYFPISILFLCFLIFQSKNAKKNSSNIESLMSNSSTSIILMTTIMTLAMSMILNVSMNQFKSMKSSS